MHSSRMRTACSSSHLGESPPDPPRDQATPLGLGTLVPGTPQTRQTPRDQAPPGPDPRTRTPQTRHPLGPGPPDQAPPDQPSPQDQTSGPGTPPGPGTPHVDRQTPVNILPCPKLRLRAVNIGQINGVLDPPDPPTLSVHWRFKAVLTDITRTGRWREAPSSPGVCNTILRRHKTQQLRGSSSTEKTQETI